MDILTRVVAIVRANRGRVNYRMLTMLTGAPAAELRPIVREARDRGWLR